MFLFYLPCIPSGNHSSLLVIPSFILAYNFLKRRESKEDRWELAAILISFFPIRVFALGGRGGLSWRAKYQQDCTKELVSAPLTCSPRIASLPFTEFLFSQQLDVPATGNTEVTHFVVWWSGKLTPAGRCFSIIKRSKSVPTRTWEDISARERVNTVFYASMLTGGLKKARYQEKASADAAKPRQRGAGETTGANFGTGSHINLWGWRQLYGLWFLSLSVFLKALCFYRESVGKRSTVMMKTQNLENCHGNKGLSLRTIVSGNGTARWQMVTTLEVSTE